MSLRDRSRKARDQRKSVAQHVALLPPTDVPRHLPRDMLASLFRGSSSQRSSQYIESVTDDAHTRSLLFGQSQHVFTLHASPPPSPFGSPALRASSYDDQDGLELEEKDVRILLAQDAHGGDEKPTLLFDSRASSSSSPTKTEAQLVTRPPLPSSWRPLQPEESPRNRSSTFSAPPNSWSKVGRDHAPKDEPFLDCMFGVPSSAKSSSATKMHIVPAKSRRWNASERGPKRSAENIEPKRRVPLTRAHTSGQTSNLPSLDLDTRDALLITRLFHVSLDGNIRIANSKGDTSELDVRDKPPKLVERKVPAYGVGLVVQLPHHSARPRSAQARFAPGSSYSNSLASATSSYESDMQSSWSFLDAIPASLSTSMNIADSGDQGLDLIVENWDIVLRAISSFERIAVKVVEDQLQNMLRQTSQPQNKMPKEKSMQRINQRMISIRDTSFIAQSPSLIRASADVSRRLVYAVRIPRVVTGLGFTEGHWTDEARLLHRVCGGKHQSFFLFNLLTAFLGNHMQWLERLAPEWYRKQLQANHRKVQAADTLASRTVIVAENKGLARRLIYILASFFPGRGGIDGLLRSDSDGLLASSTSPSRQLTRRTSTRKGSRTYNIEQSDDALLANDSSPLSAPSTSIDRSPRKQFVRKDSNKIDIAGDGIRTTFDHSAGTSSAIVPQAATTPAAYISLRNGSFTESAILDPNDSIATADLSKVLSRAASTHRRTSSVSSRWGSLVSGISDMWSTRQSTPGDGGSITTVSQEPSPTNQHKRSTSSAVPVNRSNPLQMMVNELEQTQVISKNVQFNQQLGESSLSEHGPARKGPAAPRLHVDGKDGVIDVELELPSFLLPKDESQVHRASGHQAKVLSFGMDGSESVCSLRSIASKVGPSDNVERVNVGGYLRRHHEDFVLHAVRPYRNLHDDIRHSMLSETTPQETIDSIFQDALPLTWVAICTTLVADTKSFEIRRLTLRRQYEVKAPSSAETRLVGSYNGSNLSAPILRCEEITDEAVMEFDTTLADAIEKLLNPGTKSAPRSTPPTRTHSRNVSLGSSIPAAQAPSLQPSLKGSATGPDHRDLLVGALEDVVNSVNNSLHNTHQDTRLEQRKDSAMQENSLREGVRRWMLDIEQRAVW